MIDTTDPTDDLRWPRVSALLTGMFAWAYCTRSDDARALSPQEMRDHVGALLPSGPNPSEVAQMIAETLEDLLALDLIEAAPPSYGEARWILQGSQQAAPAAPAAWREQARTAAERIVTQSVEQLDGAADGLLWPAVRTLDLLDRGA